MRLAGRERLGFYPLPIPEAQRIRRFLRFPVHCSALDPSIGEGGAFAEVTGEAKVTRYGIELDAQRAALARSSADEVIHGDCFDVQCPVESFSLIYLNPPYDFEIGEQCCPIISRTVSIAYTDRRPRGCRQREKTLMKAGFSRIA